MIECEIKMTKPLNKITKNEEEEGKNDIKWKAEEVKKTNFPS